MLYKHGIVTLRANYKHVARMERSGMRDFLISCFLYQQQLIRFRRTNKIIVRETF